MEEKKNLLWLWITLSIIFVVLVAGSAFVYGKEGNLKWNSIKAAFCKEEAKKDDTVKETAVATTDPTADWETIQLAKLDLSAKYPNTWGEYKYDAGEITDQGVHIQTYHFTNNTNTAISYETAKTTSSVGGNMLETYYNTTANKVDVQILKDNKAVGGLIIHKKDKDVCDGVGCYEEDTLFGIYFKTGSMYTNIVLGTMPDSATNRIIMENIIKSITTDYAVSSWKTFNLDLTKSLIKYPSVSMAINQFSADSLTSPKQYISYSINRNQQKTDQEGIISEYNVNEWLKGPNPDDGYVLDANKRLEMLNVMKEIYSVRALTDSAKTKLDNLGLEFLTYTAGDRIYVGYLESSDGKAKGLAMINTHGQDVGLSSIYKVSLYNQEKNSVFSIEYKLSGAEIDALRAKYGDYTAANLVQIDRDAHSSFKNMIINTPRSELSFGGQMDKIDLVAKSWSY